MARPTPIRFQGDVVFDPAAPGGARYRLKLASEKAFRHYIKRFVGPVTLQLASRRPVRSYKQNRRYWGGVIETALEEAEEFTGHSKDELHEIFKQRHLKPVLATFKGKDYPIWSTKRLTVGEFVEYCMKVEQDLAELGIRIPTPDEYYRGITE